jgi:cell division transport system permease protein
MAMARRVDYYFRETLSGLRRNGLVAFAAVSTMFISLFLLGGAQLIGRQIGLVIDQQTERVEVAVYLDDGISQADSDRILAKLNAMPEVDHVRYESKQQAYERFQALFANQPDLVNNVSANALPASYRVKLADPSQFRVIYAQIFGQPGVEQVVDERAVLDRLFAVSRVLRWGAYIATAVMLISSIALIANTVRMAVFARRKEIGIMRLVGATNWFIRIPFLIEGLVEGLVGAALAIAALAVLRRVFFNSIHQTIAFLPVVRTQDLLALIPLLLVVSVVVALMASALAMRRFLEV